MPDGTWAKTHPVAPQLRPTLSQQTRKKKRVANTDRRKKKSAQRPTLLIERFVAKKSQLYDKDNLYGGSKALTDQIKLKGGAGLILDDNPTLVDIKLKQTISSAIQGVKVDIIYPE